MQIILTIKAVMANWARLVKTQCKSDQVTLKSCVWVTLLYMRNLSGSAQSPICTSNYRSAWPRIRTYGSTSGAGTHLATRLRLGNKALTLSTSSLCIRSCPLKLQRDSCLPVTLISICSLKDTSRYKVITGTQLRSITVGIIKSSKSVQAWIQWIWLAHR